MVHASFTLFRSSDHLQGWCVKHASSGHAGSKQRPKKKARQVVSSEEAGEEAKQDDHADSDKDEVDLEVRP